MLFIVDAGMPAEAQHKLRSFGEVIPFATRGITYEAISGHPDIFFCPTPAGLVVASNLPEIYLNELRQRSIPFLIGENPVGKHYPSSAPYNALAAPNLLIHNTGCTDPSVLNQYTSEGIIHVNQGYTRCSLIQLATEFFVTCDQGIANTLGKHEIEAAFIPSGEVRLAGYPYGFLGGACGIALKYWFICGNLKHSAHENAFRQVAEISGTQIIELYDGPLTDVGTILSL